MWTPIVNEQIPAIIIMCTALVSLTGEGNILGQFARKIFIYLQTLTPLLACAAQLYVLP